MAKFPVEISDQEGIVDAVNNLLSGPAGLGQNFAGASFSYTRYLTGNFRVPFTTSPIPQDLYVAPIGVSTVQMLSPTAVKFTFTTAQPSPPFALGNVIEAAGVADSFYNDFYLGGVAECTTTYVIARFLKEYPNPGNSTGGNVSLSVAGGNVSTDGDARVTVNSATDRVFVSAQLTNTLSYLATVDSELLYTVRVNRYIAFPSGDANNPDFLFDFDETIAYREYTLTALTPTAGTKLPYSLDTVFTNIIDVPPPGYYRYILEVEFDTYDGDAEITQSELGYTSLACQVVKE